MDYIYIALILTLFIIILILLVNRVKTQKEIESLSVYLSKVQDRLELPEMAKIKEGNLSILQSEIYKVVALLKQSYSIEKKQKTYMADMLSDISHQIKTPLTAITVMTDLLSGPNLDDTTRIEYVAKIEKQNKKIAWLIKNLLTLSQLEAGCINFKIDKTNLSEIIMQIKDTFEIMAEIRMVSLSINVDPRIYIDCDRRWTSEAISNIVKNCIEHTQEGGIVQITAFQDNLATHIHISDNGEGISKQDIGHIFDRFYKTEKSSKDSVGIGLSMAKQIIMKQKGMILVTSELGNGSDFYIKFYKI